MTEHRMLFPFKRGDHTEYDADGPCVVGSTWVPGWNYEQRGPEDTEMVWDGLGEEIRTIISTHKPGAKWPERVFYVRQWRDPDGKVFGRSNLRITTMQAFRRWASGQRWRDALGRHSPFEAPLALYLHCASAPALVPELVRSEATITDDSPASGTNQ